MNRRFQVSGLALMALVALAIWASVLERPTASGLLTLSVLDIGQGDALLLTTPLGHEVLIDAGPDTKVLDQLDAKLSPGNRTIDLAIVSHNHSDHIGGLAAVMNHESVKKVWQSGALESTQTYHHLENVIHNQSIPTQQVKAGDNLVLDGVHLTVLYPLTAKGGDEPVNQHDDMVVVLVEYGVRSMILDGDLEAAGEQAIIDAYELTHPVDVLKVGHHGSHTSSSEAWLTALHPSIALISVGAKNKFGHPHQDVLDRLLKHGIQIFRTDEQGTIQVHTDGSKLWTETERE